MLFYYAKEESDDIINSFTEPRVSPEMLEECSSKSAPEMPTVLLP